MTYGVKFCCSIFQDLFIAPVTCFRNHRLFVFIQWLNCLPPEGSIKIDLVNLSIMLLFFFFSFFNIIVLGNTLTSGSRWPLFSHPGNIALSEACHHAIIGCNLNFPFFVLSVKIVMLDNVVQSCRPRNSLYLKHFVVLHCGFFLERVTFGVVGSWLNFIFKNFI